MRSWILSLLVMASLILAPFLAVAQSPVPVSAPPVADQQLLKPAELEALVAPIALYPDTLLAEVLMAKLTKVMTTRGTFSRRNM